MELRKSVFLNTALFFSIAVLALIGVGLDLWPMVLLTKPLLLVVLSVWFFFSSRRYGDRFTLLVQTGLFFSLIGDIALMFAERNEFNFLLGLGAFLIAVFAYTMAYMNNIVETSTSKGLGLSIAVLAPILALSVWGLGMIRPHLHEMQYPVLGYSGAVIVMAAAAAFRYKRTYRRSYWAILIGSVLLLICNLVMGYDKFVEPLPGALITMTALYAIAQYLIVRGALVHIEKPKGK